ncbi:hypothetical protein M5E87_07260 [Flavonifractor plautii]|nr:hypothetical protein M5E87_07260 [Flavonifractor plautii]
MGGRFLAMKGVDSGEEINHAARCISILGGRLLPSVDYVIPGANVRHRWCWWRSAPPPPRATPPVGKDTESPAVAGIFSLFCTKTH